MRFPIILAAAVVGLLPVGFASAKEASDSGLHVFYGEIVALDPIAKRITIKNGSQRFTFRYTDETKISGQRYVRLDRIRRGSGAAVVMRVGEGNVGIALRIRIDPDTRLLESLAKISAKTVHGETIRGLAVHNFIEYQPPPDAWRGGALYQSSKQDGIFVLSVAPDGTVSHVTFVKSLEYPELNARVETWLKKWRFHPNAVTEVRLSINYSQSRY